MKNNKKKKKKKKIKESMPIPLKKDEEGLLPKSVNTGKQDRTESREVLFTF